MTRRIILILIVVSIGYFAIKWLGGDSTQTKANPRNLTVSVISPERKAIAKHISVTGMTIPREEIVVITELAGVRVREISADVGDIVKKGQKLAVLDGESLNNQLVQLQSDYERANDEFKRVDSIKDTGAISLEMVTQKRTAMQSAKAMLDDAKLNLKRSIITAPNDGIIFERNAAIGALIDAKEPLYRIARHNEIEVAANVPEAELANVEAGQIAIVETAANEQKIEGKVRLVTPHINSANRTASIRISLPKGTVLAVGLFADAVISTEEKEGMVLPATAIQKDDKSEYVWKVEEGGKVSRLTVKVILHNRDNVMVEDIASDTKIIARAGAFIKEGDSINIAESVITKAVEVK